MIDLSTTGVHTGKRRLVLHIGTHRTGTTSLQRLCWDNRARLLEYGWLYPVNGRSKIRFSPGHHQLSFVNAGRLKTNRPFRARQTHLNHTDILEEWDRVQEELSACPDKNVILSSEAIGLSDPESIRVIKDYLRNFDVEIVIYLRNLRDYFLSAYKQRVRTGYTGDFRKFVMGHIKRDSYSQLLDRWAAVFGRDRIKVRLYDKIINSPGLVADFFNLLNLPDVFIQNLPLEYRVHVSPGDNTISMVRNLNVKVKHINKSLPTGFKIGSVRYIYGTGLSRCLDFIAGMYTHHALVSPEDIDWLRETLSGLETAGLSGYIEQGDEKYLNF